METKSQAMAAQIRRSGIVVIIRGQFTYDALAPMVETLVSAQLNVVELTLNSLDALSAIERLRARFDGQVFIGAGTVRTAADAVHAREAGAQFLICPGFSHALVAEAQWNDLLAVPGVMTPSEAQAALDAGCRLQKLFPAETLGGVDYLKAIRAPLDDIDFIPTGGVSEANIAAYRKAGAAAVAIGSMLVAPGRSLGELAARARECHRLWQGPG